MKDSNFLLKIKHKSALKKNLFFRDMTFHEIDEFLKTYKWNIKIYDKGEINFNENVFSKNLNIVLDGIMKISKITETGTEILYDILEPGRYFGLTAVYINMKMDGLQTEALKKSYIFYLENCEFKKIIFENPLFLEKFIKFQESRFHFFVGRFENSFIPCPYEKLLYFFNFLKKWDIHEITMSKVQLANYLNIGRGSLYREFNKIKEKNLIDITRNKIYIK
ncbi:MAG: Crp/Fnr family transcriptional regulator [Fusobacteriaceae bacterium]|nr:Crp/Fnr family transcriptional regulator [Fusobacteriaceae bacterium]